MPLRRPGLRSRVDVVSCHIGWHAYFVGGGETKSAQHQHWNRLSLRPTKSVWIKAKMNAWLRYWSETKCNRQRKPVQLKAETLNSRWFLPITLVGLKVREHIEVNSFRHEWVASRVEFSSSVKVNSYRPNQPAVTKSQCCSRSSMLTIDQKRHRNNTLQRSIINIWVATLCSYSRGSPLRCLFDPKSKIYFLMRTITC